MNSVALFIQVFSDLFCLLVDQNQVPHVYVLTGKNTVRVLQHPLLPMKSA